MIRKIRARFSNGVIKPLENVEFPEGSELTLTITENPTKAEDEAFLRAAESWRGLIDDFDLMIASTATHYNLTILTDNRKHFERVEGLEIISLEK